MQPKASPGHKLSTFDREGARSDSAPLRGLPEGSRSEKTRRVIVAVPVGAKSTCEDLKTMADEVVCALIPEPLEAVGQFYRDFNPTSDQEVRDLLRQSSQTQA